MKIKYYAYQKKKEIVKKLHKTRNNCIVQYIEKQINLK